jgi:heme exporter protein B
MISPVDRGAIYLGKFLANLVLLLVNALFTFFVFVFFFEISPQGSAPALALVTFLACVGFIALGTLFSAIAANSRLGDTLIPILVIPTLIPVIIYGVRATQLLLTGRPVAEVAAFIRMLGAFDLIFLLVCTMVFATVVEE